MEVGLSSEKLGFIFHCCHYFESDFEIDGAKLMRFSDIFARMTVSLSYLCIILASMIFNEIK